MNKPDTNKLSLLKTPPQNIEAEEALLGAILVDNENLLDILEVLTPADFYKSAHGIIFSAITELFNEDEPVDLITLSNKLREKEEFEKVGGAFFLARLADAVPLPSNAKHYANIVRDKATLRRLIEKASHITKLCYEDSGNVIDVIDFAENAIFEISENKTSPGFFRISNIVQDAIDAIEERQSNKALVTGVETGFSKFDEMTAGLQKSDFIIVAGRPSMGKTAFGMNIARNAAVNNNIPVAIFSLEMSKEQLAMRLLCSEAKIDSSKIRSGFLSKDDFSKITDAAGVLSEAPIYIDDSPRTSAMEIRTKARRLKMEKDLGLVVIDYIQLMKTRSDLERRDLEISDISRSLKILAKELDIPVVALSQLNRKLEERHDKRPVLSDLRESGALEQDADVVTFIYRDEVYNKSEENPNIGKAEILIRKQRNGPTGTVALTFLSSYTRFENAAVEYEVTE
ncbi:MAG: replicative DNA helicase [Deltaproteobacteria bacterium]|nr:replicative DNA helicase [Deltaproteobacteria bacterium]